MRRDATASLVMRSIVASSHATLTYLCDHEPALGVSNFPLQADWTSGHALARAADLLIHDGQYSLAEYGRHVGWGHCALEHAIVFAEQAGARHLVTFHHDPAHDDPTIDRITSEATASLRTPLVVTPGAERAVFDL